MSLILDLEASTFHHEIDDHLLDGHVGLAVLHDLLAVHFGDRVDVGWKSTKRQNES